MTHARIMQLCSWPHRWGRTDEWMLSICNSTASTSVPDCEPCGSNRMGDMDVSVSGTFSFRTPQPTGYSSFPQKLGGDSPWQFA